MFGPGVSANCVLLYRCLWKAGILDYLGVQWKTVLPKAHCVDVPFDSSVHCGVHVLPDCS